MILGGQILRLYSCVQMNLTKIILTPVKGYNSCKPSFRTFKRLEGFYQSALDSTSLAILAVCFKCSFSISVILFCAVSRVQLKSVYNKSCQRQYYVEKSSILFFRSGDRFIEILLLVN